MFHCCVRGCSRFRRLGATTCADHAHTAPRKTCDLEAMPVTREAVLAAMRQQGKPGARRSLERLLTERRISPASAIKLWVAAFGGSAKVVRAQL